MPALISEQAWTPSTARRLYFFVLALTLVARAVLAVRLPLTGDEAYFLSWGLHPAPGFYDHPPMVGWWLAGLAALSLQEWVLRLPALGVPVVLSLCAVTTVSRHDERLGWLAGTLVLLAPINAWNVAITTDVPLMLFSGLCVLAYARAQRTGAGVDFLLAGLLLGAALLSKYFAGLLALAIFAHSLWRPTRRKLLGLALVVLASLPSAVFQIAWNYLNCWPNVMFNLVNRHDAAGLSWRTPLLYLASAAYVVSPPVVMALLRRGPRVSWVGTSEDRDAQARLFAVLVAVPLLILGALSLVKTIGLHWIASFTLPAVLWCVLGAWPDARGARLAVRIALGFALLHYVVLAALLLAPTQIFERWRGYPGLVMTLHGDELRRAVEPAFGNRVLASSGYSPAVTMSYAFGRRLVVFGPGSSHARHDDILTDFRVLAGRDFLIVRKDPYRADEYEPYFESVRSREVRVRGAVFYLIEGQGFRYERYRDGVLEEVRRRYYAVPRWLPRGPCYLCDRYFPQRSCHR